MMLIGGAIAALLGLILLIVGIVQNNSLEGMIYAALGGTAPGTAWIVIGIILMIVGIGIVVVNYMKKKKQ